MRCGCGAEYEIYDHGLGYILRGKNWEQHKILNKSNT